MERAESGQEEKEERNVDPPGEGVGNLGEVEEVYKKTEDRHGEGGSGPGPSHPGAWGRIGSGWGGAGEHSFLSDSDSRTVGQEFP